MKEGPDIVRIASLVGDAARANMLTALMAGKALTASELASEAGITPQTASSHLRKLEEGGLIAIRPQGRHRYFTLAGEQVARTLESLMDLAEGTGHLRTRTGPKDDALREARVCYNHLAGQLATRLFDHMKDRGLIDVGRGGMTLTAPGHAFAELFGIDSRQLERQRGPVCRECLDWSERRSHLAGSLGRAMLAQILEKGWATRDAGSRAVKFSPHGRAALDSLLR